MTSKVHPPSFENCSKRFERTKRTLSDGIPSFFAFCIAISKAAGEISASVNFGRLADEILYISINAFATESPMHPEPVHISQTVRIRFG